MKAAVLLDTCALLYIANGSRITREARRAIARAEGEISLLLSPVSALEIGLLSQSGRKMRYRFHPNAEEFVASVFAWPSIAIAEMTPQIAFDATRLPEGFHADPGDRLLIATARRLKVPLMTRDAAILDYGAKGHCAVIEC